MRFDGQPGQLAPDQKNSSSQGQTCPIPLPQAPRPKLLQGGWSVDASAGSALAKLFGFAASLSLEVTLSYPYTSIIPCPLTEIKYCVAKIPTPCFAMRLYC